MLLNQWDSETLYLDNDDYFNHLIKELPTAKHSVDFEVFTFEDGVLARRLLEIFKNLTQKGVIVRVLCDGWGSPLFWTSIGPELKKAGVRVKVFRALPWRWSRNRGEPLSLFGKLWKRLKRINRGFHRKVVIIDRRVVWAGSLNVTDVHLKEVYGKNAWSDVGGRFEGPETFAFAEAFEKAFYSRKWYKQRQPRKKTFLVIFNDSWLRRRRMTFLQKQRIRKARNRIWIQNPYFVPERTLLRAIKKAAKRGVDVRILLPEKNDQPIVKCMSFSIFSTLLSSGVRLFEYQPRFAHKKVVIVDELMTIGSNNFNHRSFLHDLEVEIILTHPENKNRLEMSFKDDLAECVEITLQDVKNKSFIYRVTSRILFFFRYFS